VTGIKGGPSINFKVLRSSWVYPPWGKRFFAVHRYDLLTWHLFGWYGKMPVNKRAERVCFKGRAKGVFLVFSFKSKVYSGKYLHYK
jgi:hypothetical protein